MDTAGLILLPFQSIIVIDSYAKPIPYTLRNNHCHTKYHCQNFAVLNLPSSSTFSRVNNYIVRLWHYTYPYTNYINKIV